MKKKCSCLVAIASVGFLLLTISDIYAEMVKEVCIGVFEDAPNEAEIERYYLRFHGPEILQMSGPWMRRYQLWLPYVPPEEAVNRFGALRGRYAELWYTREDYLDRPGTERGTLKAAPRKAGGLPWKQDTPEKRVVVMVQAKPTDVFYNSSPEMEDTAFIRWVTAIKYPEGVSVEDGEEWFLNTHAKEAVEQPGLLKFSSYRVISIENKDASHRDEKMLPVEENQSESMVPEISEMKSWVRINEYWYKDFDAWEKAVVESPPEYTAPHWGGEYPFVEMRSTFIPYMHYVDFLKGDFVMPGK